MREYDFERKQEFERRVYELQLKRLATPPDSAFPFAAEARAVYYSLLRRNLQTVAAGMVMHDNQQLDDLRVIQKMREEKHT